MQLLSHLGFGETVLLAVVLGGAFGASFLKQLRLLSSAQAGESAAPSSSLFSRITHAGLSIAIVFLTIVVSKSVTAISYQVFIFIAAFAAITVIFALRSKQKHGTLKKR
jgi:hypothetical protein